MKQFILIFVIISFSVLFAQNKSAKENHAPVFVKEMPDTFVLAGKILLFQYKATDPDGDSITYSAKSVLPINATFLPMTGVFSWRPFNAQRGMYELIIAASDGKLTTYSKRAILTTDFHVDFEPGTPHIAIAHNVGGEVSHSWIGDTVVVRAIPNKGYRFTNWTENGIVVSTDSVYRFVVTFSRDLLANFRETHAPVFVKEMPDTLIICGRNYIYTYKATDPDGDSLKFFPKTVLPQNCILLSSGVFGWRPFYAQNGIHEISVYVTDGDLTVNSKVAKVNVMCISDVSEKETIPLTYSLSQNYPNPFNPRTTIEYSIPVETRHASSLQKVTLKVFDLLGREVATLVDEYKQPGQHNCKWRIENGELPSGIYFYRLQSGSFTETKKLVLMK